MLVKISISKSDCTFDENPLRLKIYYRNHSESKSLIYNVKCTMIKTGVSESTVKILRL